MLGRTALVARGLATLWAAFWLFFFVAESLAWHTRLQVTLAWTAAGIGAVVLALVPWRWELTGGVLLVVFGFAAAVAYAIWSPAGLPEASRIATTLAFGVPPVASGILFLVQHHA